MRFLTYYFFILANLIIANDKGMDLFNNGNYKEAAEYYSSILKERSEDNAASFSLGASQYYMEDNVSALKSFEQALSSKDRMLQSKAFYNIARILQDQNELDKSLSLYKKSLELNPNDIDSKINYELLQSNHTMSKRCPKDVIKCCKLAKKKCEQQKSENVME